MSANIYFPSSLIGRTINGLLDNIDGEALCPILEVTSKEGFKKFDPVHDVLVNTEMRFFYFYFNRQAFVKNTQIV